MSKDSGGTARLLIGIALALQIVGFLVLLALGLAFSFIPFLGAIVLFLAFVAFICVILVYVLCYRRAADGDYEGAAAPTLVFGILGLVTGGIVTGVLLIVAYVKLGDAQEEAEQPSWQAPYGAPGVPRAYPTPAPTPASGAPAAPLAAATRFCPNCGAAVVAPSRFCRSCGASLA
jgi:predicted RNA-binding Zn-ribbon protein involved in translation (DUF1610 family)